MNRIIRITGLPAAVLTVTLLMCRPSFALSSNTVQFNTVDGISDGCMTAALDGKYVADAQAAINRINEIRYEACQEGIADPRDSSRALTADDYVPIKWSSSLEYIARVRAAEASISMSHTRPNGESCFSAVAPDGVSSYGEVLAWNYSSGLIGGINQWYEEKYDWVNKTGAVTGHYTQMIDPSHTYVGIGCFLNENGVWYSTTAGEFSSASVLDSSFMGAVPDCRVIIEILRSAVSSPRLVKTGEHLKERGTLDKGDAVSYALGMAANLTGDRAVVFDAGTISWTSGDPSVASVDTLGNVKINGVGSVVIKAISDSGQSADVTLAPAHRDMGWKTETRATKAQAGLQTRRCGICGEILESTVINPIGEITLASEMFTYNGKKHTPGVTVKDTAGAVITPSYYSVKYSNNKKVGEASAVVAFKDLYDGSETLSFDICPKKVSGLKGTGIKKGFSVSWKKAKEKITGYEIEYSLKKNFSKSKTVTVKKKSFTRKIRKLKAKKKYFVRIRAYYKAGSKKIVSAWSKTVKIKTKQ